MRFRKIFLYGILYALILTAASYAPSEAQNSSDAQTLIQGSPIEREFSAAETHSYLISLSTGQFLRLSIEQRGIDVSAKLFEPSGGQASEGRSVRTAPPDHILLIAGETGAFKLEISALNKKAAPGRYRLLIEALREAVPEDRFRASAQKAFYEAERHREKANAESLRKALEKFEEALPLYRNAGDRSKEAAVLNRIGSIYGLLREPRKGVGYAEESLKICRAIGESQGEASALNNLGLIYNNLGEVQKAMDCFVQGLSLARAAGDREREGRLLNNLGLAYMRLGDLQTALYYYEQALELKRAAGNKVDEANTLGNMGTIRHLSGDYAGALKYFNEALSIQRETRNRLAESITLNNIGAVLLSSGEKEKAFEHFNKALPIVRELDDKREEAVTLKNLGDANYGSGRIEHAMDCYALALSLFRSVALPRGETETLASMARLESDRGNLKEALALNKSAIDVAESVRAGVNNPELRAAYSATQQDLYELRIDLLMRMGKLQDSEAFAAEALETSEQARARSLLDILIESKADIRQGTDPVLLDRELSLREQIGAKEKARVQLLNGKHTVEQAAAAIKETEALLVSYQEIQSRIRSVSPRYAALTQPQPLNVKEIRRLLDDDSLLLEYSLGKDRSYLWAVTSSALYSYELPKREEIEAKARRVYELLIESRKRQNRRQAELAAAQLSEDLLGPVAPLLGNKRLIIAADGALHYVPFGALPAPVKSEVVGRKSGVGRGRTVNARPPTSDFRPLIVDHEIVSLPSASVLALLRNDSVSRKPAEKTIAVFADPVLQSDDPRIKGSVKDQAPPAANLTRSVEEAGWNRLERLQYTRLEAESIVKLSGAGESLKALDFEASREAVTKADLEKYRIIHFATHGLLNNRHPELSGIVLSLVDEKGEAKDGFLRAQEIYNMRLNADLVVLSACRTALGKEIKGEGLVSLVRGFMYAGAARVAASLWDVRDEATAELMKRFYEGVLKGKLKPADALRRAQVGMLKEKRWEAPYYWAAFQIQGDWK